MTSSKVDVFLNKTPKWQAELEQLRRILLDCMLTEDLKWGKPCYSFQKSNVAIIYSLKDCAAIGFFNGALLSDEQNILIKPGENTQAGRWIKLTSVNEIMEKEDLLKAYIYEAIEVEKAGLKVELKKVSDYEIPIELQEKLEEIPAFKTAFEALTPGRQKAYFLHFAEPKQAKTRVARVEKYIPQILNGKGIHDCTCGLSKKMPYCDGSHSVLK
jgi:uncharacterized protein YdeI (YjbR/CyaY-like superfamily)